LTEHAKKNRSWAAKKLEPEVSDPYSRNLIKISNPSCSRLLDGNPEKFSKSIPTMIEAKCSENNNETLKP